MTRTSHDEQRSPRRREVFGYCMFDFANSSYTTLISTVAYSVYFRQAVVGATDPRGDLLWSAASVTAHVILILSSPVLGALADHSGRKKAFLLLTTVQTVIACALLFLVRPGDIWLGMLLFVVGMIGFEGGYIFYNAFLPEVSTPQTIGRVSGWSWGTGFIGGLVALVACLPLLRHPLIPEEGGGLDPVAVFNNRLSFLLVAVFFAVFSIPTFLFLRQRGPRRPLGSLKDYAATGFRRVSHTLQQLRRYRETAKFVAAAMFFYGGIETVIKFSGIYAAKTFGFQAQELLLLFIFANIVAVPGTLLAGYVADWIGGRRALIGTLILWIGLLWIGATATTRPVFWALTAGIAIGMGSTQAIGRSFMSQISPASRKSEFFGFYLLCNKLGSILSLSVFGGVSWLSGGNQRVAVLAMLPAFVIGLALLLWVNEARAHRAISESSASGPAAG
jgi:UMF1 family MFS transporter